MKEKEEVNDTLNKNVFCGMANFKFLAAKRNDTTQVISRFRSTFPLKMFRSFGYMKGHGVMLCQKKKMLVTMAEKKCCSPWLTGEKNI